MLLHISASTRNSVVIIHSASKHPILPEKVIADERLISHCIVVNMGGFYSTIKRNEVLFRIELSE